MALLLGGCRIQIRKPESSDTKEPEQTTPESQLILTGGLDNYIIITPEYPDQNETQAAKRLKESIQEKVGVTLTVKSDFVREGTNYTVQDKEILIGKTNRTESITTLGTVYYLGDYYVGVHNSKLVILSNSYEGYAEAIAYLLEHSTVSESCMAVSRDLSYGTLANREAIMNEKKLYPQLYWGFENVENGMTADQSSEHIAVLHGVEPKLGYTGNGILISQSNSGYVELGKGGFAQVVDGKSSFTVSFAMMPFYRQFVPMNILTFYLDSNRPALQIKRTRTGITVTFTNSSRSAYQNLTYTYSVEGNENMPVMSDTPVENSFIWQVLTLTVDLEQNSMVLYVNGKSVQPDTAPTPFKTSTIEAGTPSVSDTLGGPFDSTTFCFAGLFDELAVYDHALTAEEVLLLTDPYGDTTSPVADTAFLKELIERMGDSAAFYTGSGNVLYQGKMDKLDRTDYSQVAQVVNGALCIPEEFVIRYFGDTMGVTPVAVGGKNYYALEALCQAASAAICSYGDLTVVSRTAEPFDAAVDVRYLDRMCKFYTNEWYPQEPTRPYEQTRVVVEQSGSQYGTLTTGCVGSPSITRLGSDLFVSLDTRNNNQGTEYTEVYRSTDGGKTWVHTGSVYGMLWATIFSHGGDLYIIGTYRYNGARRVGIVRSTDSGATWTTPTEESGLLAPQYTGVHCAPTPVLYANGKIYRAFEEITMNGKAEIFHAFMIWADEDSDLLDPDVWQVSATYQLDDQSYRELVTDTKMQGIISALEGNAVLAPDGSIVDVLRINTGTTARHAEILVLNEQNKTLAPANFDGMLNQAFVEIPTGNDKFTIRFDETTQYYLAFVNNKTAEVADYMQRNVLSLAISRDLVHWELVDTVLTDRTMMNYYVSMWHHGFQYVDWIFDGDDIIFVVRESMGDSINFHDTNYVTMYRMENYAEIIREFLDEN